MSDATDITVLLRAVASGDATALEQLLPQVYSELRRLARAKLRHEQAGHTLTPTDLVHEAYLKLVPIRDVEWQSRAHFFAIASRAMRHVLVDHAERRNAVKRGGGQALLTLSDDGSATATSLDDLIALGDALSRLERVDARQARVVECRFFGGLSLEETAEALNISAATVSRDWTFARAWLHRELDVANSARPDAPASH